MSGATARQPHAQPRVRNFCSGKWRTRGWFYDRDFWRSYLTTLVTSRFNRFSSRLGMGYNSARGITDGYLVFPYPFFVGVPGFDVHAKNLSDAERARNLATLKFIGAECARLCEGCDFNNSASGRWPTNGRAVPQPLTRLKG